MRKDIRKYLIIMAITAILGTLIIFPQLLPFQPKCLFYSITGIPCPGCGSTRATQALLEGDISGALWFNPLAIMVDLAIIVYIVWYTIDIIKKKDTVNALLKRPWKKAVWIPLVFIIFCNWIFNIYKYLIIP